MAIDPENDFYGASVGIWDNIGFGGNAPAIVDGNWGGMIYMFDDQDSLTFSAGDSVLIAVNNETDWPYPNIYAGEIVCTAVVECGAASSGTFRLHAGLDPDFAWDNPAVASEDLGEFSVSGVQRIVSGPISSFEDKEIFSNGDTCPMLFIEVLTGTVEIRQVRVRVWPVGGPLGGAWVAGDWIVNEDAVPTVWKSLSAGAQTYGEPEEQNIDGGGSVVGVAGGDYWVYGDNDAAFSLMTSDLAGVGVPSYRFFSNRYGDNSIRGGTGYYWALRSIGYPSHQFSGSYDAQMAIVECSGVNSDRGPDGWRWRDPDRIPWESTSSVRASDGGTATTRFGGWTAGAMADAATDSYTLAGTGYRVWSMSKPVWTEEKEGYAGRYWYNRMGAGWPALSSGGQAFGTSEEIFFPGSDCFGVEVTSMDRFNPPSTVDGIPWASQFGSGDYVDTHRSIDVGSLRYIARVQGEWLDPTRPWVPDGLDPLPIDDHGAYPGRFLMPVSNLDGLPGNVAVNFATT